MSQERNADGRFGGGTKLTKALGKKLVEGVALGLFDAQNALKNGIDVATLKSWVDRGIDEEAEEPFRSFAEAYIKAAVELEEGVIGTILNAADEYTRELQAVEEWEPTDAADEIGEVDSSDSPRKRGGSKKTRKEAVHLRGDWKAAAWYAERRWPLRWGITRQPEGGPKEAIKLPDAPMQRRKKVQAMIASPPPDLVKALRDAGFELVRKAPAP
jgi:hypothetical protein